MKKIAIAILAVVAVIAIAVLAYSFFREPEAASGPIEAIPIAANVEEPTATDAAATAAVETSSPADVAQEAMPTNEPAGSPATEVPIKTTQPTQEEAASAETGQPAGDMAAAPSIFEIVPAESVARFLIDEVLRGDPITVVGSTDQVAGQLAVDPNDLSTARVGTIQVNARTLTTDNQFRNRAIKNRILQTDSHEFVTFVPLEIAGLPATGTVGETYAFQITGDLTVKGVTREVTFDVAVTPVSEARIEGLATTAFLYTDFELLIPDAPAVDTVEDEVRLEFAFVADALQ